MPRVFGLGGFRGTSVRFYRPYYSFRPRLSFGFGLWVGYPITYPYSYGYYDPYYDSYYDPYRYSYGYSNPYTYPAYNYSYPSTRYPAYPSSAYPQSAYPQSAYPQSAYPQSAYPQSAYPQSVYPQSAYPQSAYPQSAYPQSAYPQSAYPPASGSISVQPGQDQADRGGLSFEVTPATAQVFVDGALVGTVANFTPTTRPLGLTPGRHRIEIRAPGYQTMEFDADIVAGQVIPYQGTMQR